MKKAIVYILELCFIIVFVLIAIFGSIESVGIYIGAFVILVFVATIIFGVSSRLKSHNKNGTSNSGIDKATLENLKGVRESLRPAEPKNCPYCGSRLGSESARCSSCGAKLDK